MTTPEQHGKKEIVICMAQELYPMDLQKRRNYIRYHAGRAK